MNIRCIDVSGGPPGRSLQGILATSILTSPLICGKIDLETNFQISSFFVAPLQHCLEEAARQITGGPSSFVGGDRGRCAVFDLQVLSFHLALLDTSFDRSGSLNLSVAPVGILQKPQ